MTKLKTRSDQFKNKLLKQSFVVGECIPSERQLAEKYGVSRATIGRVISELVSEGMLERKWGKGVYYLGTQPKHIFVLFHLSSMSRAANPTSWFVTLDILKGILAASRNRTTVDLCESVEEIKKLAGGPQQGVIKMGEADDQLIELSKKLPCVLVNNHELSPLPSVNCDLTKGVYNGVSHLIKKGCKNFAYVGGPLSDKSQKLRFEGYRQALQDHGINFLNEMISECSYGSEEGEKAINQLTIRGLIPDAVMCADDLRAFGVYQGLKKAGLTVPKDVKILGFDDIPDAEDFEVPLSTLRYPRYEMGELAVAKLASLLNGQPADELSATLDMELVLRKSG